MSDKPEVKTQEQSDLGRLRGKSYDEKLKILKEICPKYGVEFLGAVGKRNEKKADRTTVAKKCPVHGVIEVKMRQMTEKGSFRCDPCFRASGEQCKPVDDVILSARRRKKYLETKAVGGEIRMVKGYIRTPRKVYAMISECGEYMKVGVTTRSPLKRMKEVNRTIAFVGGGIKFIKVFEFNTIGIKAAVVETQIKIALADLIQTDLPKFPGSTEILKARNSAELISKFKAAVKVIEGKHWRPEVNSAFMDVDFGEGEIIFKKVNSNQPEGTSNAN